MKTDARTRYTKKVIRESLFSILKDKPLNKISVKSICDEAEINRTTFYRYYADPFELMRQIEDEYISSLRDVIESLNNKDIHGTILRILETIAQKKEDYMLLVSEQGNPLFLDRLLHDSFEVKENDIGELYPNSTPKQKEWLFTFMTYGFTNVLKTWVKDGMKEPPIEVADFISGMNKIVLEGIG